MDEVLTETDQDRHRCVWEATAPGTAIPDKTEPGKVRKPMDEKVQRWLNYHKQRRRKTMVLYRHVIDKFEKTMNVKAIDLLKMEDEERIQVIEDYLNLLSSKAPKTQNLYIGVVKSFLSFYRKPTRLTMKIRGVNRTPTLKNERIPDPAKVRELLNRVPVRLGASFALIAFAGLRFETQVKLKLEDLIDFDIAELKFTKIPALIYVPAEKSKNGRQYFTFLIKEGCEAIESYIRNRQSNGETLTEESYVISRLDGGQIDTNTLRTNLSEYSHAILNTRSYVLRCYFNTSLLAAGVHPDWKRFFTGHKGDIEEIYSTRKQLPEWAIEKMREAFQPAANQLSTMKPDTREQEKTAALAAIRTIRGFANNFGIDEQQLKDIEHQLEAPKQPA